MYAIMPANPKPNASANPPKTGSRSRVAKQVPRRPGGGRMRLGHEREGEGEHRDRDHGERREHAAPAEPGCERAADRGSDERAESGHHRDHAERAYRGVAEREVGRNRPGDDDARRAGEALHDAQRDEQFDVRREHHRDRRRGEHREANEQHGPSPEPVRERAIDELAGRHAEEERRERELHGSGSGAEGGRDLGERREVHVGRERADRGDEPEHREEQRREASLVRHGRLLGVNELTAGGASIARGTTRNS
jgi:hypothetical protein